MEILRSKDLSTNSMGNAFITKKCFPGLLALQLDGWGSETLIEIDPYVIHLDISSELAA